VAEGSTFIVASSSGITRAGFTFNNWSDGLTGYAPGASYTMGTSNVTLTATWTAITHTVTYALGGGTGTVPTQSAVAEGATFTVASSSGITRAGYTFNNWFDGTTGYAPGATYNVGTSNITLTATWTPIIHTVTYALGGGTGTLPTQADVAEGTTFTVASSSGITRAGYTFNNWSDGTTGYVPGASYTMGTSNVTLTATWILISVTTHTVTYALGGGTGTLPTQADVAQGSSFIVASSSGITRTGFTFNNWSDGSTGYVPGASYTMSTSNVTLTATWTAITYSVTYASGGGTGTVPTQSAVAQGSSFIVASSSGINRTGFTFNNWSDGSTGYAPGSSYLMGASNVTLTATWTAITRSVTYALGGGTGTVPTQLPVAQGSSFIVASSAGITRAGYTFNNWSDGTTGYAPGSNYTVGASNVTLTATWTATIRSITYALGGGTGTLPAQSDVAQGSSFIVGSSAGITRSGFSFNNWSDGSTGYAPGATYTVGSSNVTLTATWLALPSHTITFDANGGVGTMADEISNGPMLINANTFTRSGFTFAGWMSTPTGGTHYEIGDIYSFTSDLILYAEWSLIPTTGGGGGGGATPAPVAPAPTIRQVTFNGAGATGGTMTVQSGSSSAALSKNTYVRPGYEFEHWSTKPDVDGTLYNDGQSYEFTSDLTLYAHWGVKAFSRVTFESNGANPGGSVSQEANQPTVLASNRFVREGYSFKGWAEVSNGSGLFYVNGATYAFDRDVILFAQWTLIPVTPTVISENSPLDVALLSTESKTLYVAIPGSNGTQIPAIIDVPSGIVGVNGSIRITPVTSLDSLTLGIVTLKVEILDSFGAVIPNLLAPMTIRFKNALGENIVAESEDGYFWTAIPRITGTTLPAGLKAGYYIDADGVIVVVTSHLTQFGLKRKQTSAFQVTASSSSINTFANAVLSTSGGSGNGAVRYTTSTPAICSVSAVGLLAPKSSGKCLVSATKGGDAIYLHSASSEIGVKVTTPGTALSIKGTSSKKSLYINLTSFNAGKSVLVKVKAAKSSVYKTVSKVVLNQLGRITTTAIAPKGSTIRIMIGSRIYTTMQVKS
jgi:uncharacterized repeat protein (TIGR02543 family)